MDSGARHISICQKHLPVIQVVVNGVPLGSNYGSLESILCAGSPAPRSVHDHWLSCVIWVAYGVQSSCICVLVCTS